MALAEYHLAYDDDCAEEIRQSLEEKLDAQVQSWRRLIKSTNGCRRALLAKYVS